MKKNILLKAPLLTRSGYGEQSRFALRALRSRPDLYNVYIQPLSWGQTSWISEASAEREWIDDAIEKTIAYIQQGGKFDASIQVTVPNEFEKMAPLNIGYTAGIETTKVAPQWLEKSNQTMDRLIVVSTHSKKVFQNTVYKAVDQQTNREFDYTLQIPVDVVNYPVKDYADSPEVPLQLDYDFNFLVVSQYGPRKNVANTIKWFISEFKDEEVGLVVKTNMAKNCHLDFLKMDAKLKSVISDMGEEGAARKCKVYLLHGDMTDAELHSLYTHPKLGAFVSLAHGEGYGLPLFEAAYSGMPIVAVGWSGHLDFLVDTERKERFYNVAFDINKVQESAVWDGVIQADSMWAFARQNSAKKKMRECYEDICANSEKIQDLQSYAIDLHERFSAEKLYEDFLNSVNATVGSSTKEETKVIVL